ncbi:hypothetical protein SAMN05216217_10238 [Halopseudomonas yangmingensis]|uniref:DUF721 domain-containing protein n=2 Tax=Halopseudomonas yangmingensis TaxID=1720063 RepID=A0A1I4P0U5_9GAMM|nr:hypothetical protein SAMN05216217_10238 [Halopseudomonas yangmingensis]
MAAVRPVDLSVYTALWAGGLFTGSVLRSPMSFTPLDARRPADLLLNGRTLKSLVSQARQLQRLQTLLETRLEPAAREHCRVASLRDGVLRLVVTDSHWATRLRYQQKRLIRDLQAFTEFGTLNKIQCKVQPPLIRKQPPGPVMRHSATAADSLQETAEQISDPQLRAALERLARHHREG